jgi:hypothetical protein
MAEARRNPEHKFASGPEANPMPVLLTKAGWPSLPTARLLEAGSLQRKRMTGVTANAHYGAFLDLHQDTVAIRACVLDSSVRAGSKCSAYPAVALKSRRQGAIRVTAQLREVNPYAPLPSAVNAKRGRGTCSRPAANAAANAATHNGASINCAAAP